ncbi:MAG: hypothetical protein NTW69_08255 [Chloroflexi bacterium]|jgi:hypothetical protein|nr:hypothetical protein [Chloroflexota bacterium]
MKRIFVERRGKIEQMDRSFDLIFWQAQPAKARFDASWELVTHYMKVKGYDVRQLRLQRLVTNFQRPER